VQMCPLLKAGAVSGPIRPRSITLNLIPSMTFGRGSSRQLGLRIFRLNFELDIEVYHSGLGAFDN